MAPRPLRAITAALAAAAVLAVPALAQDIAVSATVDRTHVPVGSPLTLTLTIRGDGNNVELQPVTVPEAFTIAARSQSTSFSLRAGAAERSTSVSYVLIPRRMGTFTLGPFTIRHEGNSYATETVEVTVAEGKRPRPDFQGPRYLL